MKENTAGPRRRWFGIGFARGQTIESPAEQLLLQSSSRRLVAQGSFGVRRLRRVGFSRRLGQILGGSRPWSGDEGDALDHRRSGAKGEHQAQNDGNGGRDRRGALPRPGAPGRGLASAEKDGIAIQCRGPRRKLAQGAFESSQFRPVRRVEGDSGHGTPNLSRRADRPSRYRRWAVLAETSMRRRSART